MSRKLRPEPKLSVAKRQPPRWQRERNLALVVWILIPLIIASVLGLVGYWAYDTYAAPWHHTVVVIDQTVLGNETGNQTIIGNKTIVRMDYYVKMLRLYKLNSGNQSDTTLLPYQTLNQIVTDELTRRAASNLGIQVAPGNITQEIYDSIRYSVGGNLTEAEVIEIYEGWLDRVRLSDSEYRQVLEAIMLRDALREYFKEKKVPKETEQLHLYAIVVANEGNATEVRNKLLNGGNFSALVQEYSIDETLKLYGGDLGWVPRGLLNPEIDAVAFTLGIGNISEPIETSQGYYVIQVAEIDENRPIEDTYREILASNELENWLNQLREATIIKIYLTQSKIDWAMERIQ